MPPKLFEKGGIFCAPKALKGEEERLITGFCWDKGCRRDNQDSLSLQEVRARGGSYVLAVVCDGIGGMQEGETASGYVAEELTKWFYEEGLTLAASFFPSLQLRRSLEKRMYRIGRQLRAYGREQKISSGTTCTAAVIRNRTFLLAHLGDSRAYQIGRKCRLLTCDHVGKDGGLMKGIGTFEWHGPDLRTGYIGKEEALLLCTDGFYRLLRPWWLISMLEPAQFDENAQVEDRLGRITRLLIDKGERDNISAIYVKGGKSGGAYGNEADN